MIVGMKLLKINNVLTTFINMISIFPEKYLVNDPLLEQAKEVSSSMFIKKKLRVYQFPENKKNNQLCFVGSLGAV